MSRRSHRLFARPRIAAAVAWSVAAALPLAAWAANTDNYVGASGTNWNNTNDWIVFGTGVHTIPAAGDTANISLAPASPFLVNFDGNYTAATALAALTLDSSTAGGVTLKQATAGDNLFATYEYIGYSGIATFSQSTGTNSVGSELFLATIGGSSGSYTLSGGSLLSSATSVGAAGAGVFTQSGGTHTITNNLWIGDQTASASGTYSQSAGVLSAANEYVGYYGTGSFIQSGGTNSTGASATLYLGYQPNSHGLYSLSGTGSLFATQAGSLSLAESIGTYGTGSFVQSGGTNTSSGWIQVGEFAGANGSYVLSGGTLSTVSLSVGVQGTGTFNQTGGTLSFTGPWLTIGDGTGTGTYSMSGGVLNLTAAAGSKLDLGSTVGGSGSFIQTGGTVDTSLLHIGVFSSGYYSLGATGSLSSTEIDLGEYAGSSGTFVQTGGSINVTSVNSSYVGYQGTGTFVQSGGTNTITNGTLRVGGLAGSQGTYSLSGTGSLVVNAYNTANPAEFIGYFGSGTFVQSGGANTSGAWIYVGSSAAGSYTLSGGTLTTQAMSVGYNSAGSFSQSGGTVTITGSGLFIGSQAAGIGSYTMSSGALNQTSAGSTLDVGEFAGASGSFVQSGGNANVDELHTGVAGTGFYSLGPGGALTVANMETVGGSDLAATAGGTGTFVQSGGTHTVGAGPLYLGYAPTANGTYTLSNGSLLTTGISTGQTFNGGEFIGYQGSGTFVQSGGTHSVSNWLFVGDQAGSNGTYSISAGNLSAPRLSVGLYGNGLVTQLGGTVAVTGDWFTVGDHGGTGTYILSGGLLTHTANGATLNVGDFAPSVGSFVQSGGTANLYSLTVGTFGTGSYSLSSAGSLSVVSSEFIGQGAGGSGTFVQTGGTNTVPVLELASVPTSTGIYTLSGGSLTVTGVGGVSLGAHNGTLGGTAALAVNTGGTMTVAGSIAVYNTPGTALNLAGGIINTGGVNLYGPASLFNWTGGTLNITADTTFDSAAPQSTTSGLFGSSLSLSSLLQLMVTGNETLGGVGPFSLTLNADGFHAVTGTATINPNGTLTLNGGFMSGNVVNEGAFNFNSGGFSGRLINRGSVTLQPTSNFSPTDGLENDAALNVPPGTTLSAYGSGIDNLGTLTLNNATIAGTAAVLNDFGGVLTGSGTISQGLTNNGTINASGVLTSNGTVINQGVINLPSATTLRGTGAVTNTGLLSLSGGAVASALSNNGGGVIQGFGSIANFQGNSAGGQINVPSTGGPLNVNNAWTNSGLVILQGPGALLGGGAITNSGTIQGSGTVGGTVLNTSGAIQPTGGQLVLAGAGNTNAAAAQFQITSGNSLFVSQGLATNNGTIALSGGTFDNNNQPLTNNAAISGNGTIRTGGLTNAATGAISLADLPASVLGPVTNSGHISLTNNTTTFYGLVTNNAGGVVKVTTGVARFLAPFTNNGAYNSDPADNYFTELAVSTTGFLQGGRGDRFFISGDLLSSSIENRDWQTESSLIALQGTTLHRFSVTGVDDGPDAAGYVNNFAVGTLELDGGGSLTLVPAGPHSALYVEVLQLAGGIDQIGSILGNGATMYYDPLNPANAYLSDQSYALSGGGQIVPVPEPAAVATLAIGAMLLPRRRCRRSPLA